MNILYQTCGKLNSTSGGTERTTITMAEALAQLYEFDASLSMNGLPTPQRKIAS